MRRYGRFAAAAGLLAALQAGAAIRLGGPLADGAVVQSGVALPVWGTAAPGAPVTVSFADASATATAAADGRWRVDLPPLPAGARGALTVAGDGRLELRDVVAGEVWLCAGQSNMEAYLHGEPDWPALRDAPAAPDLRLFKVGKALADTPTNSASGSWHSCAAPPPGLFSAVGYRFGRALHEAKGVPVGIIQATMGGTLAWGWTPREALATGLAARIVQDEWHGMEGAFASLDERAARERTGGPEAKLPRADWLPAALFNGMIAPLAPYAVRGVAWYQGESDGWRGGSYRVLLPALIGGWRDAWQRPDLPFLVVQLPRYNVPVAEPMPRSFWAELREAQLLTAQTVPRTYLAVTIDLASGTNISIHPPIKRVVAERLVQLAHARVHGVPGPATGPLYAGCRVEGARLRLRFTQANGALVLQPGAAGFAIAGADRKFRWAQASVDGATLLVWHPEVAAPAAARYAWAENAPVSLFDAAGLPASPFRTDDWPGASRAWAGTAPGAPPP